MSEFSDLLARRRAAEGLSLRQLAGQTGVGYYTIHRIEHGYMPDLEAFLRLCRWLRVQAPPASFIGSPRRWILQAGIPWLGRLTP